MKAMLSTAPGGPESLELTDLPTPEPGPEEVRIAVKAAGCNFPDTLVIQDLYQFKPERPFAPGSEVAGIVDAVGENVTTLKPGDRVQAFMLSGAFASHAVIAANGALKIPDEMPFDVAAGFVMAYGTSYYALKNRGQLKEGETLLVLGAAGGVGLAAVELGAAMGARVIAAASSEDKCALAVAHGASESVVYPKGPLDKDAQRALSKTIKEKAGPDGVSVAYDPVGGDYAEPAIRSLGWDGRFLVVGFPAGIPSIPLNLTLLKSCQIRGVFWGAALMRDLKAHEQNMRELMGLYAEGKLRPHISARYPLADAGKALADLAERRATGKIILTMD
ncbi:MAG: NADPH:quinone oxidoreductase family protein [Pseudomonadota bacterium]